jgi:hypothetical protein
LSDFFWSLHSSGDCCTGYLPLTIYYAFACQNELAAILRFGAEELFKDEKNEEDVKSKLENMDIDEILARAEKVETKSVEVDAEGNELLSAFKVYALLELSVLCPYFSSCMVKDLCNLHLFPFFVELSSNMAVCSHSSGSCGSQSMADINLHSLHRVDEGIWDVMGSW